MIKKVDHIGIALDSIEEFGTFLKDVLGVSMKDIEEIPHRKLRVVFYPIGDTDLELLEETGEETTISDFLTTKGNGYQHLAFEVEDIDKMVQYMRSKGIDFIEKEPQMGARNRKIIFIKPEYTDGVLIELCQCIKNE